jgi:hypothetical protein
LIYNEKCFIVCQRHLEIICKTKKEDLRNAYMNLIKQDRIQRWIKQGRGQGIGEHYKPWFKTKDVHSIGKVVRVKGWNDNRVYQLLSGAEELCFYYYQWLLHFNLKYIREQYPCLPIEATVEIAERLGIKHPIDNKTGELRVRTIDFLIDVEVGGRIKLVAISVKRSEDQLSADRTIELLEIERTFCQERGIEWYLVTENEIPINISENVRFVHHCLNLEEEYPDITPRILTHVEKYLLERIEDSDCGLADLCMLCDEDIGLKSATSLTAVKHFIASRRWVIDMNVPINTGKPLVVGHVMNSNNPLLSLGLCFCLRIDNLKMSIKRVFFIKSFQ